MSNNNLKINTPYENHFFAKEMTSRIYSGTQRAKKSCSFREISNLKSKEEHQTSRNIHGNKNYNKILKEKDKEIENLKRELYNIKDNHPIKPTLANLSNNININENFLNSYPVSVSTSNKNNSKTIFKFDTKGNTKEKVELFSDKSPMLKNLNNINNFNINHINNMNLTNRNNLSSKNFMEILNNYNKLKKKNNLSISANFKTSKNNIKSHSNTQRNQKNASSTFSNFFRKSNKKGSDNSNGVMRGLTKSKSSNKNLSKANTQTTSNLHINSNSNNTNSNSNNNTNSYNNNFNNNMQILGSQNYINKSNSMNNNYNNFLNNNFINKAVNDSNFMSEKPIKKINKNLNANESNENTFNFSDFINHDDINNLKKFKRNENNIFNFENSQKTENNRKTNSKLEMKDLDINEKDIKIMNNFSSKNSSKQIKNSTIITGKNKSIITSYSQNEKENFQKENSKVHSNINNNLSNNEGKNCFNDLETTNLNIFERLNALKIRTKHVLANYADSLNKKK